MTENGLGDFFIADTGDELPGFAPTPVVIPPSPSSPPVVPAGPWDAQEERSDAGRADTVQPGAPASPAAAPEPVFAPYVEPAIASPAIPAPVFAPAPASPLVPVASPEALTEDSTAAPAPASGAAASPAAPSAASPTREQQLAAALNTFMRMSDDVEAAALVSLDGFTMASALPEGMHEDRVGAMSAAILGLGERAAAELGRGKLSQVFIEGDAGYVLLMAAGDRAVLTALANLDAKLGLLLYDMRDVADAIADILG